MKYDVDYSYRIREYGSTQLEADNDEHLETVLEKFVADREMDGVEYDDVTLDSYMEVKDQKNG